MTSNADASSVLVDKACNLINESDMSSMVASQQHMLLRFEKTNEMLVNFNSLSGSRYNNIEKLFRQHLNTLSTAKKDLDSVHKRIRVIKSQLSKQYPEEFKECSEVYEVPD